MGGWPVRASATRLREVIAEHLLQGHEVRLDFANLQVTQSFVDELLSVLILQHGPSILDRIVFKSCSDDVRAILEFVAADRCDQYAKRPSHENRDGFGSPHQSGNFFLTVSVRSGHVSHPRAPSTPRLFDAHSIVGTATFGRFMRAAWLIRYSRQYGQTW